MKQVYCIECNNWHPTYCKRHQQSGIDYSKPIGHKKRVMRKSDLGFENKIQNSEPNQKKKEFEGEKWVWGRGSNGVFLKASDEYLAFVEKEAEEQEKRRQKIFDRTVLGVAGLLIGFLLF